MPKLINVVVSDALHSRHSERRSALLFVFFNSTAPPVLMRKFVMSEMLDHLTGLCKPSVLHSILALQVPSAQGRKFHLDGSQISDLKHFSRVPQ